LIHSLRITPPSIRGSCIGFVSWLLTLATRPSGRFLHAGGIWEIRIAAHT
jgi:hypothetical protein